MSKQPETYKSLAQEYGFSRSDVLTRLIKPIKQELFQMTGRNNRKLTPKQVSRIKEFLGSPDDVIDATQY